MTLYRGRIYNDGRPYLYYMYYMKMSYSINKFLWLGLVVYEIAFPTWQTYENYEL